MQQKQVFFVWFQLQLRYLQLFYIVLQQPRELWPVDTCIGCSYQNIQWQKQEQEEKEATFAWSCDIARRAKRQDLIESVLTKALYLYHEEGMSTFSSICECIY